MDCEEAVDRIAEVDERILLNPLMLEAWLEQFGVEHHVQREHPEHRRYLCGRGLRVAQYLNQFASYLVWLSDKRVNRYLEVGTFFGGTFLITTEYLRRFGHIQSIGIDIRPRDLWKQYDVDYAVLKKMDSGGKEFKRLLEVEGPFDLILIDGDHSYEAARRDFENCVGHARMIALHDMCSDACPGVVRLWNELKDRQIVSFTDQYGLDKHYRGMGIVRGDMSDTSSK